MLIDVVTLFPSLFDQWLRTSLLGRAVASGVVRVRLRDLRAHGLGPHRSVDDEPYGGGAGMVMRPEPIFAAVESIPEAGHVVLLSARGRRLEHSTVRRLAALEHLVLICGRYEGVDERVALHLADEELSIGDYVLAGGEAAALVVIEATTRLVPGVVGNAASLERESHSEGHLEHAQYTRPARFRGWEVPAVLLSGNHEAIARWRQEEGAQATRDRLGGTAKAGEDRLGGTAKANRDRLGGTAQAGEDRLGGTAQANRDRLGGTAKAGEDRLGGTAETAPGSEGPT